MKVSELIKKLEELDSNTEVLALHCRYNGSEEEYTDEEPFLVHAIPAERGIVVITTRNYYNIVEALSLTSSPVSDREIIKKTKELYEEQSA